MTRRARHSFVFLIIIFSLFSLENNSAPAWSMSQEEIQRIGDKVFANECASKEECLISWNEREDFLSLGIGHFIWYPKDTTKKFDETFPAFLRYAQKSDTSIPKWLNDNILQPCPWNSRDEFLHSRNDVRLKELQIFLSTTKSLQAAFIVKRFKGALPQMLKNTPEEEQGKISMQFKYLASSPEGTFALIDYANFKGLGILPSERYNNKGWGLLQVLSAMKSERACDSLRAFVESAKKVLKDRVANSPPERNEERWLMGWQNRVESYLNEK